MLKEKIALITGGATGIGHSVALRLAREGANIVITYSRSESEALSTAKKIRRLGVKSMVYKADVSIDDEVRNMIDKIIETFGRLDVLVNNAGRTNFVALEDLEGLREEHWDRVMATNVKGLFFCCRAAASELKKRNGCIVNITSVAGVTGMGSSIAYAASKAAAISTTKSLARVLAPEVRVNSVAPGAVITRWHKDKDKVNQEGEKTPLQRAAHPDDISEVVYSLIAESGYITGQNIIVDGGMSLGK